MMRAVVEHFKSDYRMGRFWIWVGIIALGGYAFGRVARLLHVPFWPTVAVSFVIGILMPTPKWVRR